MRSECDEQQRTALNNQNAVVYLNRHTVERYLATTGSDRRGRHQYFTDDGVCISVFSDSGRPKSFKGKAALARLGAWVDETFPDWEWTNAHIYPSLDGKIFIVECDGIGTSPSASRSGRKVVRYVHIFTLHDGLISEVREYSDMRHKYLLMSVEFPDTKKSPFYPL